ncbi:M17 family peptidase N-terminal domain-containing protein [Nitrincola nitratireducens]|uniref:Putative cytosol aminopeptidase n=2 Tax=Nitrincola TaxID=267849 RepID=W9UXZ8_9GAMM|nr:putative cytosol aminopeptidase [Nitrincola nitratireducens]
MFFEIVNDSPVSLNADCLVIGLEADGKLTPTATAVDQASNGHLSQLIKMGDLTGKSGEQQMLFNLPGIASPRVLVVGLGKSDERKDRHFRKLIKG